MQLPNNPFSQLYLSEAIPSEYFPQIFSPIPVPHVDGLFKPGHMLIQGTQGTGKSMLLSLLKPEIRIAYAKSNIPFPDSSSQKFIGAGINLSSSNIFKFGERNVSGDHSQLTNILSAYFSDFLNYWIVRDVLSSIEKYYEAERSGVKLDLNISADSKRLAKFAKLLSKQKCWYEYLKKDAGYQSLKEQLSRRIESYFKFLNFNINSLPKKIQNTKTSAGEPIASAVAALREAGVIDASVSVFITIDQYEELQRLELARKERPYFRAYRDVIDKMLSTRQNSVFYRLGSRPNAWHPTLSKSEQFRDYIEFNLDNIFRKREHSNRDMFPKFAADVFERRMKWAKKKFDEKLPNLLRTFAGTSPSPENRVRLYVRSRPSRSLSLEKTWSKAVQALLIRLADENVISAKLGEAWVRQQLTRKQVVSINDLKQAPWTSEKYKWWKKERVGQALLQIAASQGQRLIWFGEKDIIDLSGGSILVFVSICQAIFDAWIKSIANERSSNQLDSMPASIDEYVQDEGIRTASNSWHSKIHTDPGGGDRQRFIDYLGSDFHKRLVNDKNMSYPGGNGFCLPVSELRADEQVATYLEEATSYGFLHDREHTSKNRQKGRSHKWYLHPILSPFFDLTIAHTKEPLYLHISEIRTILENLNVILPLPVKKQNNRKLKSKDRNEKTLFELA